MTPPPPGPPAGFGFDRSATNAQRTRRAVQRLMSKYTVGELVLLAEGGGLAYQDTDPAALAVVTAGPIALEDGAVGLALTPPSGLEVVDGGLRAAVTPPITRDNPGIGLAFVPPLFISGTSLGLFLATPNPALELSGGGLRLRVDPAGGVARTAVGAALDITTLPPETTPDDDDEIAIHDDSASAHRRMTRGDFLGFAGGVPLPHFTVATVPGASPAGKMIWVTDEIDGATPAVSDGTDWLRLLPPNAGGVISDT